MFGKTNNEIESLRRKIDEQQTEIAQYRNALHQIASHVGVRTGDLTALEQVITAICNGIDRMAGQEEQKAEPGTEERAISAGIRNIKLDGCVNLAIIQGDAPRLTIRCDDKTFLPKVLTTVSGNTLTIDNEPTLVTQVGRITSIYKGAVQQFNGPIRGQVADVIINTGSGQAARKIINMGNQGMKITDLGSSIAEVTVVLPQVAGLRVKGAGKVTYHGFSQEELNLEISGSADVDLEGATDRLEAEISGSGDVSALGLSAKSAKLRVSGSGDIRATVTEFVRARVSGSGKIKIAGNPAQRDTDVTGSGKIKFVER